MNQYSPFLPFASALVFLPILLGVIVGAPLVAREFEQRTHQLVWLQSITRMRWLSVKVVVVLGTSLLAALALMVLLIWWYSPFSQLIGSFNQVTFDFAGPVLIASTAMALALGIFAGTLTRRTVFAIFLTIVLIVVIRIGVEFNLRPNYEPPIIVTWPLVQGDNPATVGTQPPPIILKTQDWNLGQGFMDAQGNKTGVFRCTGPQTQTLAQCIQTNGYRNYLSYQPANRFWTFQWIETSIYLAFTLVAVGTTFLLMKRRPT